MLLPKNILIYRKVRRTSVWQSPVGRAAPDIKVVYSRPQKKGREIFGDLIKFDKVWRTGADECTEIKIYKDMKMGGKTIKAGTYSLFTIPGEKEWPSIILNKGFETSEGILLVRQDQGCTSVSKYQLKWSIKPVKPSQLYLRKVVADMT